MKPRFRFALPSRDSNARLPALLVLVLAGMVVLQLALPGDVDLPVGGVAARLTDMPIPGEPPLVAAPSLLALRRLFSPDATPVGSTAPPDPLDGAIIAGVIQRGRFRVAAVQHADGRVGYARVGGVIAGWRLAALTPAGAHLTRGAGEHLDVAYGAHATLPATGTARSNPEDGQ